MGTEADEIIAAEDSLWSFITGWFGFLGYLFCGALVFSIVEDADFGDMLWFCVVTTYSGLWRYRSSHWSRESTQWFLYWNVILPVCSCVYIDLQLYLCQT